MTIPVLETKELHDAKASISAGMEALMKRTIRETLTPEEREARDRAEMQNLRDEAIVRAIDINNRVWWAFMHDDFDNGGDCVYHDLEYRSGGIAWWRIVGHDPELFDMFREMDTPHRAAYMRRVMGAALPQTIHPMQIIDPINGEYSAAA